jgi:hypothetical protein
MLRSCDECGGNYTARRASSRFCGGTCQKRAERARNTGLPARLGLIDGVSSPPSLLEVCLTRELDEVGRLDTVDGLVALELARRVASGDETGSATAALSRELTVVTARAMGTATTVADPLDEIKARRDRKLAGR